MLGRVTRRAVPLVIAGGLLGGPFVLSTAGGANAATIASTTTAQPSTSTHTTPAPKGHKAPPCKCTTKRVLVGATQRNPFVAVTTTRVTQDWVHGWYDKDQHKYFARKGVATWTEVATVRGYVERTYKADNHGKLVLVSVYRVVISRSIQKVDAHNVWVGQPFRTPCLVKDHSGPAKFGKPCRVYKEYPGPLCKQYKVKKACRTADHRPAPKSGAHPKSTDSNQASYTTAA